VLVAVIWETVICDMLTKTSRLSSSFAVELPLESWRVSLCGRLAWCHPRVMGWRLQRRFSLNLSSLCVTDLTAVAIHNASTTAVAVLSGDACSGKPPFTGHFCGTGICESPGQA
jgi:hypothetical protein